MRDLCQHLVLFLNDLEVGMVDEVVLLMNDWWASSSQLTALMVQDQLAFSFQSFFVWRNDR